MLQALFEFFNSLLWRGVADADDVIYEYWSGYYNISVNGYLFTPPDYLSYVLALISFIIIFVLCCLFIYRIIKLVGGLIR